MNRFQLVQVIIIAVALCLGYQAISSFCWFADQAALNLWDSTRYTSSFAIWHGLDALLFTIAFFLLLNKPAAIAEWILTKTDLDPHLEFSLSINTFLLGIIVFWALKVSIESGADIISYMANSFYESATSKKVEGYQQPIVSSISKLIAGILLLRYAKPLAQYFEQQTDENDPHQIIGETMESEPE